MFDFHPFEWYLAVHNEWSDNESENLSLCQHVSTCLAPAKYPFQLSQHKVHDLIIIGPHLIVGLYKCKRIIDNGEEHSQKSDVDQPDEKEKEEWAENALCIHQLIEIEISESKCKQSLHCAAEGAVAWDELAKEHIESHAESHEVDEEDDAEGFQILSGYQNSVSQHTHSLVELEHLDEFQCREEDGACQDDAKQFVPNRDRHEVHVVSF